MTLLSYIHALKKYTHIIDSLRKQATFKELREAGEGGALLPYSWVRIFHSFMFTWRTKQTLQTKICDFIDQSGRYPEINSIN